MGRGGTIPILLGKCRYKGGGGGVSLIRRNPNGPLPILASCSEPMVSPRILRKIRESGLS